MPGVLLELNRIARETGIRFESITPQDAADAGGYLAPPIDLVFDGNFYELSDFLYRLRTLVSVHGGQLEATGRLFTVRTLSFVESERELPADQGDARHRRLRLRHRRGDRRPPATPPPAERRPPSLRRPPSRSASRAASRRPPGASATGAS